MGKAIICKLSRSKSFGRLSLKAKVLWPMLLVSCDDQGRGDASPDVVKWYVCPNVNEITQDDVPGLLAEMEAQEMLHVYNGHDGEPLFQIVQWWKYQRPQWAQPSDYPAPEGWTDRVRSNVRGGNYVEENWDTEGGFVEQERGDNPPENPPGNQGGPTNEMKRKEEKGREASSTPPAIKAFRANAHRYPAKSWWDDVDEIVGRDPPDVERWGKTVKAYVGQGWNPTNVKNMLKFYEAKRIPGEGNGKGAQGDYGDFDFGG